MKRVKGKYVAVVEINLDITYDELNKKNASDIDSIKFLFTGNNEVLSDAIGDAIMSEVVDSNIGECKVTKTLGDLYEAPLEEDNDEK